jgi:hypothetical protein
MKGIKIGISLAAICIGFATFVVKDDRRDSMKDLSSAIDTAENTFIVRIDLQRMLEALGKSSAHVDLLHEPERGGGGGGPVSGYDPEVVRGYYDALQSTEATLNSIERLLEKFPEQSTEETKILEGIVREAKAGESEYRDFLSLDNQHSEAIKQKRTGQARDLENQASEEADAVVGAAENVINETSPLAYDAFQKAKAVRSKAEKSFRFWTKVSYAVYLAAAIIAVAGVLMGIETKEAE